MMMASNAWAQFLTDDLNISRNSILLWDLKKLIYFLLNNKIYIYGGKIV